MSIVYDQRYEAVCKYTEDGISQCKDFSNFLKKRCAIELEYTKALSKLCRSVERVTSNKKSSYSSSAAAASSAQDRDKASIGSTTLTQALYAVIDETLNLCNSHEKIAVGLNSTIYEPLQKFIKDSEQVRKDHMEAGFKITKTLQDHYTSLKKAKTEYDEAQKSAEEANDKNVAAQNTPTTKEKDLEKIGQKAASSKERAQKLLEAYTETENLCKIAQEQYYKQVLPSLLNRFTKKERERENVMKLLLEYYGDLESNVLYEKTYYSGEMQKKVSLIDVDEDIQDFIDDHVQDESLGANVSVRSLINPTKAGRMLKLLAEHEWKTRYAVLMGEDGLLYIFESEDSVKPKALIDMRYQIVQSVDESYFSRPYCLQIIGDETASKKDDSQTHYFACESEEDKIEWMRILRAHDASKNVVKNAENDYHIINSVRVEVMEGRDLSNNDIIKRMPDPYAIISLNQTPVAKTVVKLGTSAPFWGENFYFDNVHPRTYSLSCIVYNRSRIGIQRDAELGKVLLRFDSLEQNKFVEEWYPLVPTNLEDAASQTIKEEFGAVRLKITKIEERLLPLQDYNPLFELITNPNMLVVKKIGEVVTKEREEIARRLLRLFSVKSGGCVEFLKTLIRYEISVTDDHNILFRGNSLATKAVDQYMKMVGMRYLQNTLRTIVQTVYKDLQSCEVDPSRVEKPEELKKNWKRLANYVTLFWETISNAADKCPWELRLLFHDMQKDLLEKFNNDKVKYTGIAGFIFLRFFCPAILDPKLFGMAQEHPSPTVSRTLTLIAKTLQNLANLVEFGAKEPYMADMNPFILIHIDSMKVCIDRFSTLNRIEPIPTVNFTTDLRRELAALYILFRRHTELNEAFANQSDDVLNKLSQELKNLAEIYSKQTPPATYSPSSPTTTAPTSFYASLASSHTSSLPSSSIFTPGSLFVPSQTRSQSPSSSVVFTQKEPQKESKSSFYVPIQSLNPNQTSPNTSPTPSPAPSPAPAANPSPSFGSSRSGVINALFNKPKPLFRKRSSSSKSPEDIPVPNNPPPKSAKDLEFQGLPTSVPLDLDDAGVDQQ